ncbi:DUF3842 family protein [Thermodesulfobacteriota bacterium]
MNIVVMDGQGGGIGSAIIKRIRESLNEGVEIISLGTNSIATSRMMKAGSNKGASGQNAIVQTCATADIIIGPLAIIMPHAMLGEITPEMSTAVCSSRARKILIPLTQENVGIVGVTGEPLPHLVDKAVRMIKEKI